MTVHLGVRVHSVMNLEKEHKARISYTISKPSVPAPPLNAGAALDTASTTTTTTGPQEATFDADVVVGADGIKSVLRGIMNVPAPPEAGNAAGKAAGQRYTGTYCYRALVPMVKAQELDEPEKGILANKPKMVFGPGRHLTIFPIEKGTVSRVFQRFMHSTGAALK